MVSVAKRWPARGPAGSGAAAFVELPAGWDTTWKAAKAARASTPALVACIGDSITAGQNSGDSVNNSWVGRLSAWFASSLGLWGEFWPAWAFNAGTNGSLVGVAPYSTPPSATTYEGAYGRVLVASAGAVANWMVFTPPYAVTGFDLIYVDYAAGTFTYQIDGGAAQTVTTTGPGTQAGAKVKKLSIAGLSPGVHTLTVGAPNVGNVLMLVGVTSITGNPGVGVARNGYNLMRAVDLATSAGSNTGGGGVASFPPDKIALWQGQNPGGSNPTTPTGFGFPTQPHLAIIALGVNDNNYGIDPLAYGSALRRLIGALRRGTDNCSILLLAPSYPDNLYSDNAVVARGPLYHRFKRVMAALASTHNCAFVDIDAKWGELGVAKGFQTNGDLHPLSAGYADIFATLQGVL